MITFKSEFINLVLLNDSESISVLWLLPANVAFDLQNLLSKFGFQPPIVNEADKICGRPAAESFGVVNLRGRK